MPTWIKRFVRRSQSGQSILILAIGFFALLGFVGIVTDVSLMFVRYTTLTRAIDAASIAAAGQVRRQVPFVSEVADNCPATDADGVPYTPEHPCLEAEGAAFARSYGNVGVAARQFIEFYGLNPQAVLIDTCFTVSTADTDGNLIPLDPALEDDFYELCEGPEGKNFERKLIKVTAQIESPTVFMRLLGFENFLLTASAISETAVLDVVVIMDVSESMLNQTTYATWGQAGYGAVYVPPDIGWWKYNYDNDPSRSDTGFGVDRNHNFADMTGFTDFDGIGEWYRWRDVINSQLDNVYSYLRSGDATLPGGANPFYMPVHQNPSYAGTSPIQPECQVAYYPWSSLNVAVPSDVKTLYNSLGDPWTLANGRYTGFVPNYDFYRCCNDPDASGDFADLICQPFLQARDATERFIKRIDFLRGDRISFVTFDRTAFIMNVQTEPGSGVYTHMIDNEALALETLQKFVGVRAEPSFYEPRSLNSTTRADGDGWITAMPWVNTPEAEIARPDDWRHRSAVLTDHDYEVKDNCPFQDAAISWPYSPASSPSWTQANDYGLVAEYNDMRDPNLLIPVGFNLPPYNLLGQRMYPRSQTGIWESHPKYGPNYSYDLWASCRGTNMGAALRAANNALLDPVTTRTNGSVWIMVLLSDGAAGASDPVFDRNNGTVLQPENGAYIYDTNNLQRVKYGGLGVCPAGNSPADPGELTDFVESPLAFPFCSDEVPETRHFCFDPAFLVDLPNGDRINGYVDLGGPNCNHPVFYDVDDYARDWADWVGLAEPRNAVNVQRNASQLPTIFTIGFGLNFANGTTQCKTSYIQDGDAPDCLGEELLRYIADVGDNFRIDTDYQQALLTNSGPTIGSMFDSDFGVRGECEEDLDDPASHTFGELIQPVHTRQSCGNYYNAPSEEELNRVFDDIASRMFTRLSQ